MTAVIRMSFVLQSLCLNDGEQKPSNVSSRQLDELQQVELIWAIRPATTPFECSAVGTSTQTHHCGLLPESWSSLNESIIE